MNVRRGQRHAQRGRLWRIKEQKQLKSGTKNLINHIMVIFAYQVIYPQYYCSCPQIQAEAPPSYSGDWHPGWLGGWRVRGGEKYTDKSCQLAMIIIIHLCGKK